MITTGIFDKIFHRRPKNSRWAPTLSGFAPIYTQFGTDIYASDVVQQAIKCIVDEIKKLNPMHIRMNDSDPVPIKDSSIQKVLNEPNELMTTSEFIEKITWLLMMNYNAFVIPVYETWVSKTTGETLRRYKALYPIQPVNVDFIEDASGRLCVDFRFLNGYETTIPYDDVIHLKYNYSVCEYMGGNLIGQPDHKALLKTLELNEQMLQGVAKAMNASYAVNGVIKYNTYLDDEKLKQNLREFNEMLQNNESGILPVDLKAEFVPFERKAQIVDENTLKFIDEKILRNFGVPLAILKGDFTKEQYEAFFQKTLEGIIKQFSQAFTKKLFTEREKRVGNRIEFYPKELIFLSMSQTLQMIDILSPTGALLENEKRVALGLKPLPELEGKRYMSLNWIDANDASQYQTGKVDKTEVIDETKEDI